MERKSYVIARVEVLTAWTLLIEFLQDVMPFRLINHYRRFGRS